MEMREGHNIVQYGQEVDEVLNEFQQTLPEDVRIERIADQPKVVDDSVSSFVRDLMVSIVVVILVMMVLFPFRSAVVAATLHPDQHLYLDRNHVYRRHSAEHGDAGRPDRRIGYDRRQLDHRRGCLPRQPRPRYVPVVCRRLQCQELFRIDFPGHSLYLHHILSVTVHHEGDVPRFSERLPLDADHIADDVAGTGHDFYPLPGIHADQKGAEIPAAKRG